MQVGEEEGRPQYFTAAGRAGRRLRCQQHAAKAPPSPCVHLDGRQAGRQAQARVVAVRHDDAAHHARADAPAALVHVLQGRGGQVGGREMG